MMGQKMGGAATPPPVPTLPSMPGLAKPPVLNSPALPALPVIARPSLPVVAVPVMVVPAVPPAPVLRPVTVQTVTRNLQAALGPEPQPGLPTREGFPGFVSRNFNQVSQHQPSASSANMLNNLAGMFNNAAPAAPERRVAARPPATRPTPAPEAKVPVTPKPPVTTPQAPALVRKPEPPKPVEIPKPALAAQPAQPARPQPQAQPKPEPKATEKASQPQLAQTAKAPVPPKPVQELPKPAAADQPKARPLPPEEEKKPQVQAPVGSFVRTGKPAEGKAPGKSVEVKSVDNKPVETKSPTTEPFKLEAKAPAAEARPVRELEQPRESKELKNNERVESTSQVSKASPPQNQTPLVQNQKVEKMAQTRQENTELKVGEVQRQQINGLQAPITREQMELAQQTGAGVSAGGGGGNGGGGGQQRQQRRDQDGEEMIEEIGGAESLGGDDQVQWWHLRGGEENVRMLSSELREAVFNLRTPERKLGVEPRQVRSQQRLRREEQAELPQTVVEQTREQKPQQNGDQVQLEAEESCRACGHDLNGLDARRCPNCVRQAALQTLALLEADPQFIAYRVFLTVCRRPVASQAVYRLRDFTRVPSGAYCVQAA